MASQLVPDKIALVTGGGSGIGRATCKVLAREGARVVACDLNQEGVKETVNMLEDPSKHLALTVDVTKPESINEVIFAVMKKYNCAPTLLVNSAGIAASGDLKDIKENTFESVIDVNLKGTFLVCKAFANAIRNQGAKGAIVNIASIYGSNGQTGFSAYAASKGGVLAFTKSIGKELIKDGIRVNSVLPGPIETPMVPASLEIVQKAIRERSAIGRVGQPEEVAEVIAFLLSDRSSYMVASSVEVNGGFVC